MYLVDILMRLVTTLVAVHMPPICWLYMVMTTQPWEPAHLIQYKDTELLTFNFERGNNNVCLFSLEVCTKIEILEV